MHQIKPIDQLSDTEIVDLATAAAERGEPLHIANPFAEDTSQHHKFSHRYWERHRELTEVEA